MSHGILVLSAAIAGISFNCAAIFILFCCNLLRVGFSRRLTVDRGWAHRLGIPPPWRKISVSENIIAIGSRTAVFTEVRLFSYQPGFLQIFHRPLNCAAGERQILGNGTQSRPRFLFVVHPVVKININELSTMWQIGLIQLGEVWHSRHLLISADLYGGFWLIFRHPCPVAVVLRFWFLCLRELTGDSLHDF